MTARSRTSGRTGNGTTLMMASVCAVVLAFGCTPSNLPTNTIVLGEQVTAESPDSPTDPAVSAVPHSLTVSAVTPTGKFTCGQPCTIKISCVTTDPNGTVQAVCADLSQVGGPQAQPLTSSGDLWSWTGTVTPTTPGTQTITFTAVDDRSAVATDTASVTVATGTTSGTTTPSGGTPPGQPGNNIALHVPIRKFGPPPWDKDSPTWGGATATTKLTDGNKHTTYHNYPWVTGSSQAAGWVAWSVSPRTPWVEIILDLGTDHPIQGAMLHTGVEFWYFPRYGWPLVIGLQVSDDNTHWYDAGELVRLEGTGGMLGWEDCNIIGYADHSFGATSGLATHGRYVKFVVPGYPYVILDEVEVYEGTPDMMTLNRGASVTAVDPAWTQANRVRNGMIRRIVLDAQEAKNQAAGQTDLVSQLQGIINSAANTQVPTPTPAEFSTEIPQNDTLGLHVQVFRNLAALWRRHTPTPPTLIAWQSRSPWEPMGVTDTPPLDSDDSRRTVAVNVSLMQNEYRSACVNLSNTTDSPITRNLAFTGLPADIGFLKVYQVAWTDTSCGLPVAAALREVTLTNGTCTISVPSGMTRQVWLTFHPTTVSPGTCSGMITLAGTQIGTWQVRISSLQMPGQPTLGLYGWDYTDRLAYGVTETNRKDLISYLREHFVNIPWGDAHFVMRITRNPTQAEFDAFDNWVNVLWPNARRYYISMGVGTYFYDDDTHERIEAAPLGGTFPHASPAFTRAVQTWLTKWVAHWNQIGLDPHKVALLLRDEPVDGDDDKSQSIKYWGDAIHAANTGVKIWQDPRYNHPSATMATYALSACDIICPNLQQCWDLPNTLETYRRSGKELEFYSCRGPARYLDPYSYYRLQAWNCWANGAVSTGYWAFGDNAGVSSWNEYLTPVEACTPLFLDSTSVTGGKQMEAIREGVEDYEYMHMLQARMTAGSTTEGWLKNNVQQVIQRGGTSTRWTDAMDRTLADQLRAQVLGLLEN